MRIFAGAAIGRGNPDQRQHLDRTRARRGGAEALMQHDRLCKLAADRQKRVEAGHRLLEDHADLIAAQTPHRRFVERDEIVAAEQDAARQVLEYLSLQIPAGNGGRG